MSIDSAEKEIIASNLIERVQAEREQLFKAIAIVELCKLSTATLLETGDCENMVPVLETTCDLLNTSAERLEYISADLRRLSRT
ncbi:MAG: hypothetical protein QM808_09150 [Steroidobacteraceae bacterium]